MELADSRKSRVPLITVLVSVKDGCEPVKGFPGKKNFYLTAAKQNTHFALERNRSFPISFLSCPGAAGDILRYAEIVTSEIRETSLHGSPLVNRSIYDQKYVSQMGSKHPHWCGKITTECIDEDLVLVKLEYNIPGVAKGQPFAASSQNKTYGNHQLYFRPPLSFFFFPSSFKAVSIPGGNF